MLNVQYLNYEPPYLWNEILDFLADRAISGVELVRDKEYLRTVALKDLKGQHVTGFLSVGFEPEKNALRLCVSEGLIPLLPLITPRIRMLFDLDCEPLKVFAALKSMNKIHPNLSVLGCRVPKCFDVFEMSVRAVLGQQISVRAAGTLAVRLVQAHGKPINTGIDGLSHVFPSAEDILSLANVENELGALGITGSRSRCIFELARYFAENEFGQNQISDVEAEMNKLMKIKGIGPWTAKYIAMRGLSWPDAFLETDAGIKKALTPLTQGEMVELSKKWQPYRSYATINLWNSLSKES